MKSLPLESQIGQWKKEIAQGVHSTWVSKKISNGKADATGLNNLSAICYFYCKEDLSGS